LVEDGSPRRQEAALNVMVRGDEVIIFLMGGSVTMSAQEAEVSAQRLLDAAAVAQRRLPNAP
jgi:hypothetical protein